MENYIPSRKIKHYLLCPAQSRHCLQTKCMQFSGCTFNWYFCHNNYENRFTKVNRYVLIARDNYSSCIWQQLTEVSGICHHYKALCWEELQCMLITFLPLSLKNPMHVKATGYRTAGATGWEILLCSDRGWECIYIYVYIYTYVYIYIYIACISTYIYIYLYIYLSQEKHGQNCTYSPSASAK